MGTPEVHGRKEFFYGQFANNFKREVNVKLYG
jgi:hypothetical protein